MRDQRFPPSFYSLSIPGNLPAAELAEFVEKELNLFSTEIHSSCQEPTEKRESDQIAFG